LKPSSAALVVVALLAVAALAVPAAEALSRRQPPPRLASERLQTELRQTQRTLARATSQLSRSQLSQLQRTLDEAKAQLGAAEVHAADLHAQIAATPRPLAVAVSQVRHEVAWADGRAAHPPSRLVALAAMDYTVGHVSTGTFGYLELVKGSLPGYQPNRILATQAGICGQAAWVFAAIVRQFGLHVRSVTFSYPDLNGTPDGHTAAEVSYGGSWHFFDPTYGQFWTDSNGNVLSIAQIRAGLGTRVKDLASFTNLVEDASLGDDTWFVTKSTTQVQTGTLTLRLPTGH
jgi:transglutaminase-like putative cysteine protease